MSEFKKRVEVVKKGCLNSFYNPTEVCVNLGEVKVKNKRMFYCVRGFPEDCSKFGCPKMMPIDEAWKKDLKKLSKYC